MADRRFNFFYMLAGLAVPLLAAPLARDITSLSAHSILAGSLLVLFALSIRSFRGAARANRVHRATAVIGVVVAATLFVVRAPVLELVVTGLMLLFITASAVRVIGTVVFAGGRIDANYLAGAVCVYLQFALFMAVIYYFIEVCAPGSFNGIESGALQLFDLAYFSLVTLTTVGYGEIVPTLRSARALANLEAVVGQFYVAVFVATLVSRWLGQQAADKDNDKDQAPLE